MKPESVSEKMMYNTIRIVTKDGFGTGSYFNFNINGRIVPVIITNQHVLDYKCDEVTTFFVHIKDEQGNPGDNIKITYNAKWIFHDKLDICYCYVNPLFEEIKDKLGKEVYYIANDETLIYSKEKLKELSAIEELVMVGYPIGLWDEKNNLPIFRKGFTANHPAIDFNENGVGLIDMACFPGSSGSPIYILNEGSYRDKKGNTYFGNSRVILIGYLFAGPRYSANGELIVENIPTQHKITPQTKIMVNLGYYIKASEILSFKKQIELDINEK
ncbi:MAG: serine protease [Clostridia bacterium]|nr:serine protease [Clostridia bacterium]